MRTTVGIVGAGPAGLVLGRLLHRAGIDTAILEARAEAATVSAAHADLLEPATMAILRAAGAGDVAGAAQHRGVRFAVDGRLHRVDLAVAGEGGGMWLHPLQPVLRDLLDAHVAAGGMVRFGARVVRIAHERAGRALIDFTDDAGSHRLSCDVVVACDGARSDALAVLRPHLRRHEVRRAPFAWLSLLIDAPPACDELVYVRHSRGFARLSTRSATVQRWSLQCGLGDTADMWPVARVRAELERRCGDLEGLTLAPGRLLEVGITAVRSRLVDPLQHGSLLLAGDAAHLSPPTGAKGLNLALADAADLASAIVDMQRDGRRDRLETYSARALTRVRAAIDFSWWMTALLHTHAARADDVRAAAALRALVNSPDLRARFAAAYTGQGLQAPVPA